MRKRGALLFAITLLVSSLCGGCGTPMYELTAQEEAIIVQYAASTLAKYNVYQKDGQKAMNPDLIEEALYEAPTVTEPEEETESGFSINPETGEVDAPEIPVAGPAEALTESTTLAESIGQEGVLDVSYDSYYVTDSYKEGSYYFVDAKAGKKYLVMEYSISNTSGKEVALDVTSVAPKYYVSVNNGAWISSDPTFSLIDIATYQGVIPAGKTIKTISLFLIDKDLEGNIKDITLAVEQNGIKKRIF